MTAREMQAAVAREDLCRYLAACYYEPEPAFEKEGMFDSLVEAARAVDDKLVAVAQGLADGFRNTGADALLLDYTRLFLGPTNMLAQPYGSVWLEEGRTLMGDTTLAVLELYAEGGFEMDEEFREVPDHIAVELEFLYLLVFRENEARRSGDAALLNAAVDLKRRFLEQHLGRWVVPFSAALRKSAGCVFYQQLANLTESIVKREAARAGDAGGA